MQQIIYLNGPTSVGKSSIAKEIQNLSDILFLHVGIDQMIELMPSKFNAWMGGEAPLGFSFVEKEGMQIVQAGPHAKRLIAAYYTVVTALAKEGHSLIIDDVSFGIEEVNRFKEILAPYPTLFVGLIAPLKTLKERELERKNRMVGAALHQHGATHQDVTYDLMLDTSTRSPKELATLILAQLEN